MQELASRLLLTCESVSQPSNLFFTLEETCHLPKTLVTFVAVLTNYNGMIQSWESSSEVCCLKFIYIQGPNCNEPHQLLCSPVGT